jgi:hypothetical protein
MRRCMSLVDEFRLDCWVGNTGGAAPFNGPYAVAMSGVHNLT